MLALCSSLPRFFDSASPMSQPQYAGSTRVGALSASSEQRLNLSLVTAEGDKVTISSACSRQLDVGTYDYQGRVQGNVGTLHGSLVQASTEDSFSIAVEGNLNTEEVNDIKKLVAQLGQIGADLFSQPVNDNSLAPLAFGDDLNSIASFDATVSAFQQITVAEERQQENVSELEPSAPQAGAVATPQFTAQDTVEDVKNLVHTLLHPGTDNGDTEKLPAALLRLLRRFSSASPHEGRLDERHKKSEPVQATGT